MRIDGKKPSEEVFKEVWALSAWRDEWTYAWVNNPKWSPRRHVRKRAEGDGGRHDKQATGAKWLLRYGEKIG